MITTTWYLIEGVNPEPWTAPTFTRRGSGGYATKNAQLIAFQNALAEQILAIRPNVRPTVEDLALDVWIWRELEVYQTATGRKQTRHVADRSNILKATEDALQGHKPSDDCPFYRPEGILFKNDKQIVDGSTTIVEQLVGTQPCILLRVRDPLETPRSTVGRSARSTMHFQKKLWMEV